MNQPQQDLQNEEQRPGGDAPESTTSAEDKFLGVRTQIRKRKGDPDDDDFDFENDAKQESEDKAKAKAEAKPDSEGADDDDLEEYSERVQKRINKLVWQQNEERRSREAAEAMREEAVRYAQQVAQKNQEYEQTINQGEQFLIDQYRERSNLALERARSQYKDAYERGDTEAVIKAQEEMIAAQANLYEVNAYERDYRQRQQSYIQQQQWQAQQAQMRRQQPQRPQQPRIQAPKPSDLAQEWASENTWFQKEGHEDMTATAFGLHEKLVKHEGIRPDTKEYFDAINKTMRQRFPEYFADRRGSSNSAPPTTVAPANRASGKSRKVTLNANQRALIKKLGITPEQYAKQMMKVQP